MDRHLALDAVRVTEATAIAAARTMGMGDPAASGEAASDAMKQAVRGLDLRGTVVIGVGNREEAPALFAGDRVGRWRSADHAADIALDPLEGIEACARGTANAISVLAVARGGHLLPVPDTYMNKIAVGPTGKGAIDIRQSIAWNLNSVADAKGVYVADLTVVVLDRPRHRELIREVRQEGARVRLISDGDVSAAIATCDEDAGVDMLLGVGGAAEGVIAAAALRCVGGDMQGVIVPQSEDEARSVRDAEVETDRVYGLSELASGDVLFAATGVTDGECLRGVRFRRGGAVTHSRVMRSRTMTTRNMVTEHRFEALNGEGRI